MIKVPSSNQEPGNANARLFNKQQREVRNGLLSGLIIKACRLPLKSVSAQFIDDAQTDCGQKRRVGRLIRRPGSHPRASVSKP